MRPSRLTTTAVLAAAALSCGAVAPTAGHAAAAKTYLPVAGTWHIEPQFSSGTGSFVVGKSHKSVAHLSVVPQADFACSGKITVAGPLRLHKTKDVDRDDVTNWSVAKVFEGVIKVKIRQGGKQSSATLQLDLGPRNGTSHPIKYAEGILHTAKCGDIVLGGVHGKI